MNTKDFKKLLKESISNGATYILDEQEEIPDSIAADEETQTQPEQDSEEASNKLADSLKKAAEEMAKFIQNKDLNAENLAKAMTYYFIGMYWDEPQNWEASVKSNSIFNRNLNIVLSNRLKDRTNIICLYSDLLEWINKFYKSPEVLANKIERDVDSRDVSKIKSALDANLKGSYRLAGNNLNILKKMIAYNKDYDITRCVPGEELEGDEKDDKEKDEAVEEFQKLDLKVGDVVVVRNRNGKEIVTTVAEIPDELIVKENQWKDETVKFIIGGDWSIPLDGKRGFNSKGQHWIAIRDKKVAIRKATTQDIQKAVDVDPRVAAKLNLEDTPEDAETEEIPREDVETYGTPEEPQAFRPFLKGLEKVPVIRDYANEIVTALKKDIPSAKQASLMPNTIDELLTINEEEDEEAKYKLPDSENIQNIIKKIANDKLVAGKWAYTLIKRFLSRNGMDLQNAEINMKALKVIPKPEDIVPLLKTAKAVERNLEEQRYHMLLKRLKIK
jgi:hypothetical protein